ncbi:hypothetical protein EDC94DRAFT_627907 [Helicostylum pulchrum]|nr:hypothetical protein EDC94DRAFT_627907 [Helicostylum pulchrum]
MKIQSLLLGHFQSSQAFYLYRIKNTNILLFKLTQVCSFFDLPLTQLLESQSELFYRDKHDEVYLKTTSLASIAIKYNKFLLAELCKLKPTDYAANLADSILFNLSGLEHNKLKLDKTQYEDTNIELLEATSPIQIVKTEPVLTNDPMAIDSMLTHGAGSQKTRRLSRSIEEPTTTTNKRPKLNILPKPVHTVSSQQAPPKLLSNMNIKQNQSGKNTRNLTIFTPAYGEHASNGIRSAPLNSNFRQVQSKSQPHPLSQTTIRSPASSSTAEFAIPPIVPSQQQPPHTAHPSSINNHFPPHSPQYPSSAYGHSFPVTSGRVIMEPKTPTTGSSSSSGLQRQQFMQPFEHLFDTIETTRSLKSTLDDQIRRSSTLMQTLQASSTTIEGLVRNQIKEMQKESLNRLEDTLEKLFKKISVLETRANIDHVTQVNTTATAHQQREQEHEQERQQDIINPPTIVRSQNDIGPNEYHDMLNTLRERLDKLERQLDN